MKPYMIHAGNAHECAILVFANTSREAKQIGRSTIVGFTDCDYIDIRVKRMEDVPFIRSYALQDTPHVVESPPSCDSCCQWGQEVIDGLCDSCRESDDFIRFPTPEGA